MWKPQPYCLIADRLELTETGRGESCPSGQRQGRAAPGEDKVLSPEILPYIYNANKPETNTVMPRVDTAPHGVETQTQGTL